MPRAISREPGAVRLPSNVTCFDRCARRLYNRRTEIRAYMEKLYVARFHEGAVLIHDARRCSHGHALERLCGSNRTHPQIDACTHAHVVLFSRVCVCVRIRAYAFCDVALRECDVFAGVIVPRCGCCDGR